MASRPLYNGSARAIVDNGSSGALRNGFCARVSKDALTADELIANATFEAKAGVQITLNYEFKKVGAGVEAGTPTFGVVRIFKEDDDNDGTAVDADEFQSADLIGSNVLPRSGTVNFTPSKHGSYRIQIEMRKDNNDFGATSDDWRVFSDGGFQRGSLAAMTQAASQDKGRLRWGADLSTVTITERGNTPPSLFATTVNAAGTATEESVRVEAVLSHAQHTSTAGRHVLFLRQSMNDSPFTTHQDLSSTTISATTHRTESKVNRINYPLDTVNTSYNTSARVATNSVLHDDNTPQYSGLGGQSADGGWVHFTGAGAGLTLSDYRTVTKLSTHIVNAHCDVENIFVKKSATYTENAAGIPQGVEDFSFIATKDNMRVKCGRAINARGEALGGVFFFTEVLDPDGAIRDFWGLDSASFKSKTSGAGKGWQEGSKLVTVSTPPDGVHRIRSTVYFPIGTFGVELNREISCARDETGSPASAGTGKNWIAPASFSTAWHGIPEPAQGGQAHIVNLTVFDKLPDDSVVFVDADSTPAVVAFKRNPSTYVMEVHSTPVATKVATGQYIFTFTPDAVALNGRDVYQLAADVTIGSFKRRWVEDVTVYSFALASHNHDGQTSPKSKTFFDPTGLFK